MKNLQKFTYLILIVIGMNANAQTWNLSGNAGTLGSQFIGTTDAQTLKFRTSNLQRMVLDLNGRLGIGLTTPSYRLDVTTSTETRAINANNTFSSANNTYGTYSIANNPGTSGAYGVYGQGRGATGINTGVYGNASEGSTNYGCYGLANTVASQAGYGIYAASSGTGTNNYGGYFSSLGTSTTGNYAVYGTATGASPVNYGVYGSATGATTNWAGYFLQNVYMGGSVGVGTTTLSDSKFSVQQTGTTTTTAKFLNTSKGPNISWVHFGTTGDWYLRSSANAGKVVIQDQNANATVCIGSNVAATGYKLSVAGKVICTELKVLLQANWPDYVFAKDYKLMPLNQLEEYISTNNHLPDVPSAKEMDEKNGIEVGEMQTLLVKKLEEANLYILQLNKRVSELESKLK
jgi:hypothetical protein